MINQRENIIQTKTFDFALTILNLCRKNTNSIDSVIYLQLLKSGTSIGANVEEAIGGQSKKDFISKMSIAYKEARETKYWLRLLNENQIKNQLIYELIVSCDEICKIIGKILSTSRKSIEH